MLRLQFVTVVQLPSLYFENHYVCTTLTPYYTVGNRRIQGVSEQLEPIPLLSFNMKERCECNNTWLLRYLQFTFVSPYLHQGHWEEHPIDWQTFFIWSILRKVWLAASITDWNERVPLLTVLRLEERINNFSKSKKNCHFSQWKSINNMSLIFFMYIYLLVLPQIKFMELKHCQMLPSNESKDDSL